MTQSPTKRIKTADLFDMSPEALSDVKRVTVPFGDTLSSIAVSGGVQTSQLTSIQKGGITLKVMSFYTEDPIYTRLVVTRMDARASPGNATEKDITKCQMYRLTDEAYEAVFEGAYGAIRWAAVLSSAW